MSLQHYVVNLLTFATGNAYSWSSPVVPKLKGLLGDELNPLGQPATVGQVAWMVALVPLGAIFGCPVGGVLASKLGKKKALVISGVPLLLSFLITSFFTEIIYFYIAKFISGIGCGCCFTLVPLYVGETSDKDNRGLYGCFFGIFIRLGTLFSYLVGPYCSVRTFSLLCSLPVIVYLLVFSIFFPETPYHLISKRRVSAAEKSLRKLRKFEDNCEIKNELLEIKAFIEKSEVDNEVVKNPFASKASRRSLFISISILCCQQLTGIAMVISYMQTILQESGSDFRADIASTVIGVIQVAISILTARIVDKYGRRILLIISSFLISVSLISLAVFFSLLHSGYNVQSYNWIPSASMGIYFIAYCLGLGPVGWAMMGEMFEMKVKPIAASIANFCSKLCAFSITLLFPYMSDAFGMEMMFYLIFVFMLFGLVFIILFVPETKCKSFSEIQAMLENRLIHISLKK